MYEKRKDMLVKFEGLLTNEVSVEILLYDIPIVKLDV